VPDGGLASSMSPRRARWVWYGTATLIVLCSTSVIKLPLPDLGMLGHLLFWGAFLMGLGITLWGLFSGRSSSSGSGRPGPSGGYPRTVNSGGSIDYKKLMALLKREYAFPVLLIVVSVLFLAVITFFEIPPPDMTSGWTGLKFLGAAVIAWLIPPVAGSFPKVRGLPFFRHLVLLAQIMGGLLFLVGCVSLVIAAGKWMIRKPDPSPASVATFSILGIVVVGVVVLLLVAALAQETWAGFVAWCRRKNKNRDVRVTREEWVTQWKKAGARAQCRMLEHGRQDMKRDREEDMTLSEYGDVLYSLSGFHKGDKVRSMLEGTLVRIAAELRLQEQDHSEH